MINQDHINHFTSDMAAGYFYNNPRKTHLETTIEGTQYTLTRAKQYIWWYLRGSTKLLATTTIEWGGQGCLTLAPEDTGA